MNRKTYASKIIFAVIALSFCFLASPFYAFAQESSFNSVCASLAKRSVTTGKFLQTRKSANNGRSLNSNGDFVFSMDGILWQTKKPFPSTTIITQTSVIQESANGKRTVIDASQNQIFKSMSASLTSIFSGNAAELEKNFTVAFSAKGNDWSAELMPRDSGVASVMKSITISGKLSGENSKGAMLSTITITESTGDTISYNLTEQKYQDSLTNEQKRTFSGK